MSLVYSCCLKPKTNYGTFLCCLPLAFAAMILAGLFGFWSAWEISYAVTSRLFPNYATVSMLIFGIIKAIFAIFAVVAVITRHACLMNLCKTIFDVLIVICIVSFIYQWVVWGLALGGVTTENNVPWKPTNEDIANMVIVSIVNVIVVVLGYWVLGLLGSLAKVYGVGGSGCERKNYTEIREDNHDNRNGHV